MKKVRLTALEAKRLRALAPAVAGIATELGRSPKEVIEQMIAHQMDEEELQSLRAKNRLN